MNITGPKCVILLKSSVSSWSDYVICVMNMSRVLWYFNWLFSHSSHHAMNWTDLVLVMGHLKGWIGWHFTLKRKVSLKIDFFHCTVYTYYKTICHPLIWEVFEDARRLVPDTMSTAQWTLVAGWTLLLLCHMVIPISNTPPICLRSSCITLAEHLAEIPQYWKLISRVGKITFMSQIMMICSLDSYIHTLHTYIWKVSLCYLHSTRNVIWQFYGGCVVTQQPNPFMDGVPPHT